MNASCKLLAIIFVGCTSVPAQVMPASTGSGGLPVTGYLHYAIRYGQSAELGSKYGDWQTSCSSASLSYSNGNQRLPFNMTYIGGYTSTISGPPESTGAFQHLSLSQIGAWRKWVMMVSDDVSYRPQSPTTGFSGIPGIGEPIGVFGPYPPSSQTILTLKTPVVDNSANGEIRHILGHGTFFSAGGSSELLRYLDGNGFNTNTQMANAWVTWRVNARNSLTSEYLFSHFSYPDYGISFQTNSAMFGFTRQWNRKLSTDVSAGPQWTGNSNSSEVPSSIGTAANAALDYHFKLVSVNLIYSRGTNGGAGYLFGSRSDNVSAGISKGFGNNLTVGLEGSYLRTAGLIGNGVIDAKYGGVQASRRVGRYLSVFANYTAMDQSSSSALPANTLSQLMYVVGFGIELSARVTHIKR